ncbi:hypothetical protein EYR36_002424 [Pleurotus pulmonarius]|nr:hypothetical protein EYR36_002424 [Pleurotus pulmonarius]
MLPSCKRIAFAADLSTGCPMSNTTTISSRLLEYLFIGQLARVRRISRSLALFHRPSTAQRLPAEVLSLIFACATHDSHERSDTLTSPLIVSQVCSRWRRIALSTSLLWTAITVTYPYTTAQRQRIEAWLSRSKAQPLDLLLDLRDPAWNWDEDSQPFAGDAMRHVLSLLIPNISRWQYFELLSDTWLPVFIFLERTRDITSVPLLHTLKLSRCNAFFAAKGQTFSPAELGTHIPVFGGTTAGNLRVVSLAGVHVDWSASALKGLTELEVKYHASDVMPSFTQFKGILAACPDLVKLSVLGWGPRPPLPTRASDGVPGEEEAVAVQHPPIRLLKLTHFSFGFVDLDYAIDLLSQFSFPRLENLTIEDVSRTINPSTAQDATPLIEWLAHISSTPEEAPSGNDDILEHPFPLPDIKTLQFNGISALRIAVTHFLSCCSSLQSLHLSNAEGSTLLSSLKPQSTEFSPEPAVSIPCPELAELTVDFERVDFDMLADVVTSRSDAGTPSLERVFVEMSEDEGEECAISDMARAVFTAAGIKLLAFSI